MEGRDRPGYFEVSNPELQAGQPERKFTFEAPSSDPDKGRNAAALLGSELSGTAFGLARVQSLANAFLQALGGDFLPLQAWVEAAVADAEEDATEWLTDLEGWVAGLDAGKLVGTLLESAIPGLDASKIVSGFLNVLRIPDLDTSKLTSGVLNLLRIPDFDASKLTSGVLNLLRVPDLDASKVTSGNFAQTRVAGLVTDLAARLTSSSTLLSSNLSGLLSGSLIPDLDASKVTTGTFPQTRVATLVSDLAAKLTSASTLNSANLSGVLSALLVPDLDASKFVSGVLNVLRVPDLDASKVVSGQLPAARIADLDASKVTSGDFAQTRVTNLVTNLAAKVAQTDFQSLLDLGVQGATGAGSPPSGSTQATLRDALNTLFGNTETAVEAASSANSTLAQFLSEQNAAGSGGISDSATFVGANGSALNSADWTTYLGNTTPSSLYLVIKNNNAAITAGTTDGTYRPHAVFTTQYTQDDQSVAAVLQESGAGLVYSNATFLVLRSNAAMTAFTYVKVYGTGGSTPREVSIGYGTRSGTTWTNNDQVTVTIPAIGPGALVELRVAGNLYEVLVNNNVQLQWNDASSVTNRGASYRYCGFAEVWSRAFFVNYFAPELSQFSMSDYAGAGFKGCAFRFYRTNTAAVTFGNTSGAGVRSPASFYGIQQNSANVTVVDAGAGVVKIPFSGWWTFEVFFLSGAAIASSSVVYGGLYTGLTNPPTNLTLKSGGGSGTAASNDQHVGGVLGPIYLAKDTYVAPGMWSLETTSRSAKGGSLQNDCSFAGVLRTGA